jgi:RsiW-degrading membrane proteinase PrsW (M82 family)
MINLQGVWWAGIFFLLYLMRCDRHEPTPDFVQVALLLIGLVISGLLLLLWALA